MVKKQVDFETIYAHFNAPVVDVDCGQKCSMANPTQQPVCCDIDQAVPVVYEAEWEYFKKHTDLWQIYKAPQDNLLANDSILECAPDNMLFLACKGADKCQRPFRSVSCRQFPFFPYISLYGDFIGLTYFWEFEKSCWVINHLDRVTSQYRLEFVQFYDQLFNVWPDEIEHYANLSEEMRGVFIERKRRIPILHRNGQSYLLSPASERLRKISEDHFSKTRT